VTRAGSKLQGGYPPADNNFIEFVPGWLIRYGDKGNIKTVMQMYTTVGETHCRTTRAMDVGASPLAEHSPQRQPQLLRSTARCELE